MRVSTVLVLAALLIVAPIARAANPITVENARPGDAYWQQAVSAPVNYDHPPISGYAGASSVRPGETIDFHVSAQAPVRYRVQIERLGWYGGMGGRRLTCLVGSVLDPSCAADEVAPVQSTAPPPDPLSGEVAAGWAVTDALTVPATWISGYYLAIFQITTGAQKGEAGFAAFVVQAPVGDHSAMLVEVPTNTWQAYNDWGGEDVYTTPQATAVSFDRPIAHHLLFRWEYPLVRFLERGGYDVTYATDDDVDRDPSILLDHRLAVNAGHGEYWTHTERLAWDAARDHGVNLAFMAANTGYWQVRYADAGRTMISYKSASDPEPNRSLKTERFRYLQPAMPECGLEGEQYRSDYWSSETGQFFPYRVTGAGARDPWLAGTGLHAGSAIPGVVGFEVDSVTPRCRVPPVTVLLHSKSYPKSFEGDAMVADAVRYRACSGAEVFDAGTEFFAWGLDGYRDPDPEFHPPNWSAPGPPSQPLQRMMNRALHDMETAHPWPVPGDAPRIAAGGRTLRADVRNRAAIVILAGAGRRVQARGAVTLRPRFAGAGAFLLHETIVTGLVRDTRSYVVSVSAGGRLRSVLPLEGVSCWGPSAVISTPAVGGPARLPLRVLVTMARPLTVTATARGRRVSVRLGGHGSGRSVVVLPVGRLGPGAITVRVADRTNRFRLGTVALGGGAHVAAAATVANRPLAGLTVGIDPGHNGRNWSDPAFINHLIWNGRESETCDTTGTSTDGGYSEARFNWNVARYLAHDLRVQGARVVMTRSSNTGVGPCVTTRAQILNRARSAVAIDIHADGGPPGGRGFTVLEPVAEGPNDRVIGASRRFGRDVLTAYRAVTGIPISTYDGVGGISLRPDLAGLNLTTVPKVLIECANMRNATDAARLVEPSFQRLAARALARAIDRFLGRRRR